MHLHAQLHVDARPSRELNSLHLNILQTSSMLYLAPSRISKMQDCLGSELLDLKCFNVMDTLAFERFLLPHQGHVQTPEGVSNANANANAIANANANRCALSANVVGCHQP